MSRLDMPLYINPQDVADRMQLQEQLDGVLDTISSGILAAQIHVQSVIGSELQVVSRDDIFFCDSDAFSGIQPGGFFRLELASGWVRSDTAVTITTDIDWNMPNPDSSISASAYRIDYDRGYIALDRKLFHDKYVEVVYTTGFKANVPTPSYTATPTVYSATTQYAIGDVVTYAGSTFFCNVVPPVGTLPNVITYWTPVTFDTEPLPADLYEGIISDIPMIFNAESSTNRAEDAKAVYQALSDHSQMLLKKYFRLKGFSFRPVNV
jgi:hypothetical protein